MNRFSFLLTGVMAGWLTWNIEAKAESLEEVLGEALLANPQAKVALNRLKARQEAIGKAKAGFWPSLDIAAGLGGRSRDTPNDAEDDKHTYTRKEASFSIKQSLFAGFNTLNSVWEAKKNSQAEQWRLFSTLEELALKIINVYLKVLERSDLVELAEENLQIHDEIFLQIEQRTRQGVARSSDLIQVEGRRARARANLVSARNNLQDALSEYQALVGAEAEDLGHPGYSQLQHPEDLKDAINLALKEHPSLKAADFDIESAEYSYSSLKSSYLPTLDLEVDRSWKHNADGHLGAYMDSSAMVRFRYNLFRGGGDKSRIQESAYQAEESRSRRARVARDVEERLRIAWAALRFTGEQREYLLVHEEASRATVDAYREQFNIGKRTLLDLLDSENELFQSSNSLVSTIYQEAYARYRVLGATGQLLDSLELAIPDHWKVD